MKTAISIADITFAKAEALAERLGISRSRLYALALEEFLEAHSDEEVTKTLNEVYETEDSALPADLMNAQLMVMNEDEPYEAW